MRSVKRDFACQLQYWGSQHDETCKRGIFGNERPRRTIPQTVMAREFMSTRPFLIDTVRNPTRHDSICLVVATPARSYTTSDKVRVYKFGVSAVHWSGGRPSTRTLSDKHAEHPCSSVATAVVLVQRHSPGRKSSPCTSA